MVRPNNEINSFSFFLFFLGILYFSVYQIFFFFCYALDKESPSLQNYLATILLRMAIGVKHHPHFFTLSSFPFLGMKPNLSFFNPILTFKDEI